MSLQNGGRERPSNAVKTQTAVRIAAPRRSASKILLDKWKRDKNYFSRTTFVIMRCIGCVAALAGVNLQISAITTSCWYFGSAGNATNSEGGLLGHWGHESQVVHEIDKIAVWQEVAIGLLIFSIACGLFGLGFNVRGLRGGNISQKLYYTHSAGEIYFIASLCSLAVVVCYPPFVLHVIRGIMTSVHLGFSYFLSLVGAVLQLFATFCVMVDDLGYMLSDPKSCLLDCFTACCKQQVEDELKTRPTRSDSVVDSEQQLTAV